MLAVGSALTVSAILLGDDQLALASLAVPVVFVVIVKAMGLYDRDEHLLHRTTLDEVPGLFGVSTVFALLLYLSDNAFIRGELGRRQILGTWLLLLFLLVCFRAVARSIALRFAPVERCLVIGPTQTADFVREKLDVSTSVKARLVAIVDPGGSDADLPPRIGSKLAEFQIDRVILATPPDRRDDLLFIIRELKSYGVKVSVLPEASRVAGSSVELDHLHGITLLAMRRFEFTRSSRLIKRGFDLIGSCMTLAVLSPVLLAISIAIKSDSRGPVLFRQQRVGRNGHEFAMLKFRSMVDGADQRKAEVSHLNQGAEGLFKIAGDPRVTRVGSWLRRYQLDELPQLINVVRGEMSLVGPRPLIPEEDEQIEGWYRRRLDVPPGMTGHWQILGSSQVISLGEMVKLDYLYVANWSAWGDVQLLLRTIPFVARRRGL